MAVNLTWQDMMIRLAFTLIAGTLVGINRSEHSRPAGLRTTLLICLAASIAMIQANLLLDTSGKTPSSFAVLDLMRLPLGILTGVGFIGAGAILRKDGMVTGVTTAATLWFVTVMGLCFGGGQFILGFTALALCLLVLWGLKWIEKHVKHERHGTLTISVETNGPGKEEISQFIREAGYKIRSWSASYLNESNRREYHCTLSWHAYAQDVSLPLFLEPLAKLPHISKVAWNPSL
ncbi:MAG TPA: MgtC/SapB family protein [Verrucomicrobiae bacterium]|jgi:putative Mg2+ transporter-C (MgtC) family protein